MKRLLLTIADVQQHSGEYDIAIPLQGLELEDILDQVRDYIEISLEDEEDETDIT